jgi:hypothetical protein
MPYFLDPNLSQQADHGAGELFPAAAVTGCGS